MKHKCWVFKFDDDIYWTIQCQDCQSSDKYKDWIDALFWACIHRIYAQ